MMMSRILKHSFYSQALKIAACNWFSCSNGRVRLSVCFCGIFRCKKIE